MSSEEKTISAYLDMEEPEGDSSPLVPDNNSMGVIVSIAIHAFLIALFLLQPTVKMTAVKTFHISFSEVGNAVNDDIPRKHAAPMPTVSAGIAKAQRSPAAPALVKKNATPPALAAKKVETPPAVPETTLREKSLPLLEDTLPASRDDAFVAATGNVSKPSTPMPQTAATQTIPGATNGGESALSPEIAMGNPAGHGSGNGAGNGAMSLGGSDASIETRFGEANAPRFIHRAIPVYPPLARRRGKEGRVVLTLLIDQTGKVQKIDITEPAGFGLTEAAIEAVRKSTFAPAHVAGEKVASRAILPIRFKLE